MGRLELGLRFKILGFKAMPPLGETMKEEGYKTQEVF
jgi:hypothetical protein